MPGGVFLVGPANTLTGKKPADYLAERGLQNLLERRPALLDSCTTAGGELNLFLVKREMRIHDHGGNERWPMDHFFVCFDGIPTFVEVKRSTNPQARRDVVGQMLDYAANGSAYWPMSGFRSTLSSSGKTRHSRAWKSSSRVSALVRLY